MDTILDAWNKYPKINIVCSPYFFLFIIPELKRYFHIYHNDYTGKARKPFIVIMDQELNERWIVEDELIVLSFFPILSKFIKFHIIDFSKTPYRIQEKLEKTFFPDKINLFDAVVEQVKKVYDPFKNIIIFVGDDSDVKTLETMIKKRYKSVEKNVVITSTFLDIEKELEYGPTYVIDTLIYSRLFFTKTGGRRWRNVWAPERIQQARKKFSGIHSFGVYHQIIKVPPELTEDQEDINEFMLEIYEKKYTGILGLKMNDLMKVCSKSCIPVIVALDEGNIFDENKNVQSLAEYQFMMLKKSFNIEKVTRIMKEFFDFLRVTDMDDVKSIKRWCSMRLLKPERMIEIAKISFSISDDIPPLDVEKVIKEIKEKSSKVFPVLKRVYGNWYSDPNGKKFFLLSYEKPESVIGIVFENDYCTLFI
jgi:hypothetical protein